MIDTLYNNKLCSQKRHTPDDNVINLSTRDNYIMTNALVINVKFMNVLCNVALGFTSCVRDVQT